MRRRERPVVVTGLREPLVLLHRRLIRRRLVLMVIWIAGWAATGFVYDRGWLAITILVVTGPVLWAIVWFVTERRSGVRPESARRALGPTGRPAPTPTDAAAGSHEPRRPSPP